MCLCNCILQQTRLRSEHFLSRSSDFNQREKLLSCSFSFSLSLLNSNSFHFRSYNTLDWVCKREFRGATKTSFMRFLGRRVSKNIQICVKRSIAEMKWFRLTWTIAWWYWSSIYFLSYTGRIILLIIIMSDDDLP